MDEIRDIIHDMIHNGLSVELSYDEFDDIMIIEASLMLNEEVVSTSSIEVER